MLSITLRTENFATTGRPDEYKGTIAIDHHSAGATIMSIVNPLIANYIEEGYSFYGMEIYMAHNYDADFENFPVHILIGRRLDEEIWEYKKVSKQVSLREILLTCTALEIRFSSRTDFEQDNIDWNNIEEIEGDEE